MPPKRSVPGSRGHAGSEVFIVNDPPAKRARVARSKFKGLEHEYFAEGAFRLVYKGEYETGPRRGEQCVYKVFKTGAVHEEKFFDADIEAVERAGEIIGQFNALGLVSKRIFLNKPEVWTGTGGFIKGQKVLVEPMIQGEYFKFNSNTGYAVRDSDTMQALSHFSYHTSIGNEVLCDLQGGRYPDRYTLTDPVIMSASKSFGAADLGQKGVDNFMAHHVCGKFCNPTWRRPTGVNLVPTLRAVPGTTFGEGIPRFSNEELRRKQKQILELLESDSVD